MAGNIIFNDGDQLSVTVLAGTVSGDPVLFGNQPGVALTDRDTTTGKATVKFSGVIEVEMAGAAAEDAIYIAVADYALVLADTGAHAFFGTCIDDADADDMVRVRIGGIEPGSGS